jgi:hypothetical protein
MTAHQDLVEEIMKRLSFALLAALLAAGSLIPSLTSAHCQVPCGIYDDPARISAMREDAATISKAIASVQELAGKATAQDLNQATRWIHTKEMHASNIMTTVSEYFLAQKTKTVAAGAEGYDAYVAKLAACHGVTVAAMKTKQQADPAAAQALEKAIETMAALY